jgi:ABC-type amino acid transport substrate-binding protein/nitrogen-specific signal transduction histidine kinase
MTVENLQLKRRAARQDRSGVRAGFWCNVLLFLSILVFYPDSAPAAGPQPSSTGSKVAITINAASEYDYPPFCVINEQGEADGFSVELLRAALKAMGHEVSFKTGPWDQVKKSLIQGEVQVLPLVGRTPERQQFFDFTVPYLTLYGTIVVREGETGINTLADLVGRQVAVMRGDNAEEFVRRINLDATIVTTKTFEEALRELAEGQHDAVIIQRLVALQLIKQADLGHQISVGSSLDSFAQSFCFAVRGGDKHLLSLLNEGLSIVIADGTFRRLYTKWFAPIETGLKERSRIIVGGDSNYPPFEYLDENGEPAGYNVELTKAIARQTGLNVAFRLGTWVEIREALARGEIDVVQGMFYSPEREKSFGFSPAHAVVNHAVVVRNDTIMPESLSSLAGKSIMVMQGDIMHDAAIEQGYEDQLILVASQEEALQRLSAGEYDCALVAKIPAYYWIAQKGWNNLQVSDYSVRSPEYCFAVPDKNDWLLPLLSEGLANIKAAGQYRQIYAAWLGVYEKNQLTQWEIVQRFFWIIIPILVLLVAMILWLWTLRITVRKRTAELRQEIVERQQREAEIATKNLELDKKNAELERFTYSISHDLKSPLVTVKTFLGFLKKDLEAGDQEKIGRDLHYMHSATNKMGQLLADLLTMIKVGQTGLTKEQITFRHVVEDALSTLAGAITEHNVQVQVDDVPLLLYGERTQLVAIWQNLIDNAIKYRSLHIPPSIAIGLEQTHEGPVFHLRDNGRGIDPCYQEKIFGLFDQLNPAIEGSGLGLALVKRIVELNNGRIWVESSGSETGSCFKFTLPAVITNTGGA